MFNGDGSDVRRSADTCYGCRIPGVAASASQTAYPRDQETCQPRLGAADLKRYHQAAGQLETPIALSPHERARFTSRAQFLFRSRDHGQSVERISPGPTSTDPRSRSRSSRGSRDNAGGVWHTTVDSISESPMAAGLIWVVTDVRQPAVDPRWAGSIGTMSSAMRRVVARKLAEEGSRRAHSTPGSAM